MKRVIQMIAAILAAICVTAPMSAVAANERQNDVFTVSGELFSYSSYGYHRMVLETDATDANWLVAGKYLYYGEDGDVSTEYFLVAFNQDYPERFGVLSDYSAEMVLDEYEIGDLLYFRDISTVEIYPAQLKPENGEIRFGGHGTDILGENFEKVIRHEFEMVMGAKRYVNRTTIPAIYGDLNEDEEVTIMDVVTLNKSLLGGCTLSDYAKLAADVDQNGEVNAADALNTLKYVVGMIDSFA